MTGSWESLTPWEKAREWRETYPELADEIIRLGKRRAVQVWELEKQATEHTQRIEAQRAEHGMRLEREDAEHRRQLDEAATAAARERAQHVSKMEKRLWYLYVISMVGGVIAIVANGIIAYMYARAGNVAPGLAVFGAGGALTAGLYMFGRSAAQQMTSSLKALPGRIESARPASDSKSRRPRPAGDQDGRHRLGC